MCQFTSLLTEHFDSALSSSVEVNVASVHTSKPKGFFTFSTLASNLVTNCLTHTVTLVSLVQLSA